MSDPFFIEWDYYTQAFRLHQRMTKAANDETQRLLNRAIDIAADNGRSIPRADGLLGFTRLQAQLNGWTDFASAQASLNKLQNFILKNQSFEAFSQAPLSGNVTNINSLNGQSSLKEVLNGLVAYHGAAAATFDED